MSEIDPESLCANCVGACCRAGETMPLDEQGAAKLRAGGTELQEFLPPGADVNWGNRRYFRKNTEQPENFVKKRARALNAGEGLFGLLTDCGYLEKTDGGEFICGIHEDPERPNICGAVTPGRQPCLSIREKVIGRMLEEDSPDLVGLALDQSRFQALEDA